MPSFWREISDVVVRHTIGNELKAITKLLLDYRDKIQDLEARMTSAENDTAALEALYTELDQWSSEVAEELETLRQHAETGNVSAADVAARLSPIVARLKAAGQNGSVTGAEGSDPTTTTDPTNSPVATDPTVVAAPDAPTDAPTPDPTVNPVDIPEESQAGSSANDAEAQGTVGTPAVDVQASTTPDNSASVSDPSVPPADASPTSSDASTSSDSTTPNTSPTSTSNTNDYREEY